jgi:Reverse transcriptase (RNA-dependent DNA polymerase)
VRKTFVLDALLKYNYFPMQRSDRSEMPPAFGSVSFTASAARKIINVKQRKGSEGWDSVEYRATRFNGVPRCLVIPHPLPYAHLCLSIYQSWPNLDYTSRNKTSLVRPRQHADGRIIIMDYEKPRERVSKIELGKRFLVKTDIANCFPSVYSHAIPWATVGFKHAKTHKPPKFAAEWYNQLDEKIRWNKRNETQGIAIGPATSNIAIEAILARIDEVLGNEGFQFYRYIDDFTAYCETEEKAQLFIRRLSEELSKYKMLLSIKKTDVIRMPDPITEDWVSHLALMLPKGKVNAFDGANYLDMAVGMANRTPDGSVLKYAIKSLLGCKLDIGSELYLLPQMLALAYHQPALLPTLSGILRRTSAAVGPRWGSDLHRVAVENARLRRSDGLLWALYYLNEHKVPIGKDLADAILDCKDCLSMWLLYKSGVAKHQLQVVAFAKNLDVTDNYELDQYWVLLYQLYLEKQINNPYASEDAFVTLKAEGVSFSI